VQYGWNMFDRRMQREILPYCAEQHVGFMAYGGLSYGLLTGTFTEDHDFGSADWRARQGNMGAIKVFAALFGPEKFKDNVRAVNERARRTSFICGLCPKAIPRIRRSRTRSACCNATRSW